MIKKIMTLALLALCIDCKPTPPMTYQEHKLAICMVHQEPIREFLLHDQLVWVFETQENRNKEEIVFIVNASCAWLVLILNTKKPLTQEEQIYICAITYMVNDIIYNSPCPCCFDDLLEDL